jgi:hypothetical protein
LSENKKNNKYHLEEHLKNMNSLQKRLQRIESCNILDRKKNPYDPVAHPSLFFRRKEEMNNVTSRNATSRILVYTIHYNFDRKILLRLH